MDMEPEKNVDYWVVKKGWNPFDGRFLTLEVVALRCDDYRVHAHWIMPMQTTSLAFKGLLDSVVVGVRKTRRHMKRVIHNLGKELAARTPLVLVRKLLDRGEH